MKRINELLKKEDRKKLKKAAFPVFQHPMLARLAEKSFDNPDWIYERKLDGERVLVYSDNGKVKLYSRNEKVLNKSYPELRDAFKKMKDHRFVADGEIVAFDGPITSFHKLQGRMHIKDEEEARRSNVTVYYYLFDLLYADGYELTRLPLRTRKMLLKKIISFNHEVRYLPHRNEKGLHFYKEACKKGWEGVIAKDAKARYVHKRSRKWLKFRCVNEQELVIGGYTEPKGSRKGFGALLLGYNEKERFKYAGMVGTGFNDEDLKKIHQELQRLEIDKNPYDSKDIPKKDVHWVKPKLVAQVGFTEWTSAGRLRHPRFEGLRRDKKAGEIVRETR